MKLFIIRHALAEERLNWKLSDELRPLTSLGKERFNLASKGLLKIIDPVEKIISSEYTRSIQTAEILKNVGLSQSFEVCSWLNPLSDISKIISQIQKYKATCKSIAIIGHQPELGMIINEFLSSKNLNQFPIKKGSVTYLKFENENIFFKWSLLEKHLAMLIVR